MKSTFDEGDEVGTASYYFIDLTVYCISVVKAKLYRTLVLMTALIAIIRHRKCFGSIFSSLNRLLSFSTFCLVKEGNLVNIFDFVPFSCSDQVAQCSAY